MRAGRQIASAPLAIAPLTVGVSAAVICTLAVASIPPDAQLGALVRFVMFHGALTWATMLAFTAAALVSAAHLLVGRGRSSGSRLDLPVWAGTLRWLSVAVWSIDAVLGIVAMRVAWGGINWDEPRLHVTLGVLAASAVLAGLGLIIDRPRISAVFDVAFGLGLWGAMLTVADSFHPESPVLTSGDAAYIGPFAIIVTALVLIMASITARAVAHAIGRRTCATADDMLPAGK